MDAESLLAHLENVGAMLAQALHMATLIRLEVHGPVLDLHAQREGETVARWRSSQLGSRPNMKAENAKALVHPILGRYHGFTATGITLAEFGKSSARYGPFGLSAVAPSSPS
jgi:hypothetical protein